MQYGPGMHHMVNMKTLMIITGLFLCLTGRGQELRAYRQEVVGGAVKAIAKPDGTEQVSGSRRMETFIYLSGSRLPRVKEVWIDGEAYAFTVADVQSPVLLPKQFSLTAAKDTLVPATSGNVVRIIPGIRIGPAKKKGHLGVTLITAKGRITAKEIRWLEPWYGQ